eukprot:scaffold30462_cov28-Tisochrysis_lutea.AAC.11
MVDSRDESQALLPALSREEKREESPWLPRLERGNCSGVSPGRAMRAPRGASCGPKAGGGASSAASTLRALERVEVAATGS